ncbi:dihydroneopterin aldolase [Arcobacteraceae bacterium]|nr:dihydroneopterin aldolase [Arcobacteraceae bacterium]
MLSSSKNMKVSIDSLTFKTIIGILPFERVTKQKVVLDISFTYKFVKGQKDFIDYSHVANMAKMIMKKEKFLLIEDAIIYLDRALSSEFPIKKLKIKVTKPDILKNCTVSVSG